VSSNNERLDTEGEDNTIFRNVHNCSRVKTA